METIAHHLYAQHYRALYSAIVAEENGDVDLARKQLNAVTEAATKKVKQPGDVQALLFTEALRKRWDSEPQEVSNLYLLPDQGRQIQIFNLMAEKFPVVHFSQEIANRTCLAALKSTSSATILDIGIGTGQQIVRLLEHLFEQAGSPRQIQVIGIEPAEESLKQAEASILGLAGRRYQATVEFTGFPKSVENLDEADWRRLDDLLVNRPSRLVINGSFALHHIRPTSLRTKLFARLKRYEPDLLTLIEPYADFLTTDVAARFNHAWHHYGLVFQAIDQIDAKMADKNAMKSMFFRREIQDVLSDDAHRIEQFETADMWISRLNDAGFQLVPLAEPEFRMPNCPFTIAKHEQYLTENVNGYPILTILAAR